jgi:hypothetical protein
MPQSVQLTPVGLTNAYEEFLKGKVDLVPLFFFGPEAQDVLSSKDYEIHETLPLKVTAIQFSPKAMREFTPQQRAFAGEALGKVYSKLFPKFKAKPTLEFFQALGAGGLDDDQLEKIRSIREIKERPIFARPIEVRILKDYVGIISKELKDYPEIKVNAAEIPAIRLSPEKRPDMYSVLNDSAWTEDLTLVGYNFGMGFFSLPGLDVEKWMLDFASTSERTNRIKKLNQLHFDLLKTVTLLPIDVSPYYCVIKKPWELNQSNLSANLRLWRIQRN